MSIRLIKLSSLVLEKKHGQPSRKIPIVDTIHGWIREFRSTSADRARQDLERIINTRK